MVVADGPVVSVGVVGSAGRVVTDGSFGSVVAGVGSVETCGSSPPKITNPATTAVRQAAAPSTAHRRPE
jgi:hypothetical protein